MELKAAIDTSGGRWCARSSQGYAFSASDLELQQWLPQALLPEFAPYFLVVVDVRWREERKRNEFLASHYPVDQLLRCHDEAPAWAWSRRDDLYIGSLALTPDLLTPPVGMRDSALLVAGLLHLRLEAGKERSERRLRVIQRAAYAREVYGGAVVRHDGYKAVLRGLRLALGKRLRATAKGTPAAKGRPPASRRVKPAR